MTYVEKKIAHLRRVGLIVPGARGNKRQGIGRNGGACPDWLADAQDEQHAQSLKKANQYT